MEEDIVINELEQLIEKSKSLREEEFYTIFTIHEVQNIRTALNLIQNQQAEFKEKDRQIKQLTQTNKSYKGIINKKDKIIDEIKEYVNWHIDCYTEDIADYIDDDRIGNANIIGEFKEQREHWKDIFRIIDNEKTYIDYKNY